MEPKKTRNRNLSGDPKHDDQDAQDKFVDNHVDPVYPVEVIR